MADPDLLLLCKSRIRQRILETCIYNPENEYMLGKLPGTRYKSQFYMYNALFDPEFNADVGYYLTQMLACDETKDLNFQFVGTESAIPMLTFLPYFFRNRYGVTLNSVLIRKEPKKYGKHNIFEGEVDPYVPALIIDPLCNSTNAFLHCQRVLDAHGYDSLHHHFAILNKYSVKDDDYDYDRYSKRLCYTILTRDDL